jgi:hypothetical protein
MSTLSELFKGLGAVDAEDNLFKNPVVSQMIAGIISSTPGISVTPPDETARPQVRDVASTVDQGMPYTPSAAQPQDVAPKNASNASPVPAKQSRGFGETVYDFGRALQGHAVDVNKYDDRNETVALLVSKGLDEQTARAVTRNPAVQQMVLGSLIPEKPKAFELSPGQARFGPDGKVIARNDVPAPRDQIVPADSTLVRDGKPIFTAGPKPEKPPSGFEWVDPNDKSKGLSAIPGGPGEHISSEVSGRLALMKTARDSIKQTRGVYEKAWGYGELSKQIGSQLPYIGDLAHVSGEIGIANRNIKTGVEAALRLMTGAAAPETEVARYAAMFTPGAKDTIESATQKLDALEKFMANAEEMATRGRRPTKGGGDWQDVAPGVRIRQVR